MMNSRSLSLNGLRDNWSLRQLESPGPAGKEIETACSEDRISARRGDVCIPIRVVNLQS